MLRLKWWERRDECHCWQFDTVPPASVHWFISCRLPNIYFPNFAYIVEKYISSPHVSAKWDELSPAARWLTAVGGLDTSQLSWNSATPPGRTCLVHTQSRTSTNDVTATEPVANVAPKTCISYSSRIFYCTCLKIIYTSYLIHKLFVRGFVIGMTICMTIGRCMAAIQYRHFLLQNLNRYLLFYVQQYNCYSFASLLSLSTDYDFINRCY